MQQNANNMTHRKPILTIIACLMGTWMLLACQQEGKSDADRDKDEEHALVVFKKQFGVTPTEYKG